MKKILSMLLIVGASMAVFAGCSTEEVPQANYVTASSVMEKMDNDESFAFVIGDAKCAACLQYLETLEDMNRKEGILLDYIDLNDLTEATLPEAQKLVIDYLGENFEATPTTYFVIDGEPVEAVIGALPYNTILDKYNSYYEN